MKSEPGRSWRRAGRPVAACGAICFVLAVTAPPPALALDAAKAFSMLTGATVSQDADNRMVARFSEPHGRFRIDADAEGVSIVPPRSAHPAGIRVPEGAVLLFSDGWRYETAERRWREPPDRPAAASVPEALAPLASAAAPSLPPAPRMLATAATTVRVCPAPGEGCDHTSLAEALRRAGPGGTVVLAPGVYREAGVVTAQGLTLRGEKGAHLRGVAAEGKAALVVRANDVVIEGLECSEIAVPDRNGACVRLDGRDLTLRHVYFHDAEEGLLGGRGGTVTIEDSRMERLGAGGYAHGVYVGAIDALIVRRSHFLSSRDQGHEIKSRAARTIIEDSVIASLGGFDSRLLDLSNGGEVVIRNSILEKGTAAANNTLIGFAREGMTHPVNSLRIENTTLLIDNPNAVLLSGTVTPVFTRSSQVGGGNPGLPGLAWYPDRAAAGLAPYPALAQAGTAPRPSAAAAPEAPSVPVSAPPPVAVLPADPQILTVGPGKRFSLPSQAAKVAKDGDTIRIDPGEYFDCAVWRNNDLTIVGAGPDVVITDRTCGGKAIFIITGNNTTVRNITLTRARVPDENGAGIRLQGRGLTVERTRFINNEAGLLAGNSPESEIRISDSEFRDNGKCAASCVDAVKVGDVALLRIERSRILATRAAHHVSSGALRTELIGNEIGDGPTGTASLLVSVPGGRSLVMEDNRLDKGPRSGNPKAAIAIAAGGGMPPAPGLRFIGNHFVNRAGAETVFILNHSDADATIAANTVEGPVTETSDSGKWVRRAYGLAQDAKAGLRHLAGSVKRMIGL